VLEVGPGKGILTEISCKKGKYSPVNAYDIDSESVEWLRNQRVSFRNDY
jgi:16S rRNA A1518/A1519 N6-dimethyltransferase RsmA/KsgA/DIM1 with predicted DNA glycosylase/AP lyase activity